jgi:hypothetical protein
MRLPPGATRASSSGGSNSMRKCERGYRSHGTERMLMLYAAHLNNSCCAMHGMVHARHSHCVPLR